VGEEKLHEEITVDFPKELPLSATADGMRRLEAAAYTGVGLTYYFTGRRKEANKHFTAAAEADPTFDYALRYYTNQVH
jgi:tetratricopeptide (TPR) repeat protein